MSQVEMEIAASVDQVWEVLADGWTYAAWVVGASHIRDVDDGWPQPGSKLHHSVGPWPFVVNDYTQVLDCRPLTHLKLRARTWPVGEAQVIFGLEPRGPDRCVVKLNEHPTRGPAAAMHNPVFEALLSARNRETLRRLADFAARRRNASR
jgi:polyketide cyclase/dehydrase/lipid transport protein